MQEPHSSSTTPQQQALFLFNYHYLTIQSYCFNLAWHWAFRPAAIGVEDLVQEALISIWEALPRFDSNKPLIPFIKVIAGNAFKDACKRYGKYHSVPFDSNDELDALSQTLDMETVPNCVNTILDFLTERQKEILKMNFGIDQPYPFSINDIAEELGITRQTVSSDKKKAIKVLESRYCQRKTTWKMAV